MKTTFQWVISQLNCAVEVDGMSDVINMIHWRYNATQIVDEKTYFADTYSCTSVSQPNPQNFIPYADVTEAEVISWLESVLDVPAMQLSLETNLYNQQHPTEIVMPLPWLTESPIADITKVVEVTE